VFRRLRLARGASDLRELIAWAGRDEARDFAARLAALQSTVRQWVEESLGKAGGAIVECVATGYGKLVLPLGLVLRVMASESGLLDAAQREGLARVERYVGDRRLTAPEAMAWAEAAEQCFRDLALDDARQWREVLAEAGRQLEKLNVRELAHVSHFLPEGLSQREARFARELEQALASGTSDLAAVQKAAKSVEDHELAKLDRARVLDAAVSMSVRLLRWLRTATPARQSGGFAAEALAYAREGCFVDWAREQTALGYPNAELQRALRKLWAAVQVRRERENRAFAEACVAWHQAPAATPELVPLEDVLAEVVRPVAEQVPVLLVVMDGMSLSVFHELAASMPRLGWLEIGPELEPERGQRRHGVAVLPTVTEVSRASLLSGVVRRGTHDDEARAFEASQLLQLKGTKARLFHKGTLSGDRLGIEPEVELALRGKHRVVGVVMNVVDDWLGKGSEDGARWEIERIKSLYALLDLAAKTDRVVIMTSDHGHVRDHETRYVPASGGTRWRAVGPPVGEGEVVVRGNRVCLPSGQNEVVVPWTESIRYSTARQNGYHGGISPQEVLVPIAVYCSAAGAVPVSGFAEVPPGRPSWWDADKLEFAKPPARDARSKTRPQPEPMLPFAGRREDGFEAVLDALLASELFQAQKQLHLRGYPGDDKLRLVLRTLSECGGNLLIDALANRLDLARVRVQGMLAALRRVLNYDGTECLAFDVQSGTVKVQWELLRTMFDLPEGQS
jgi:hypothetical protein